MADASKIEWTDATWNPITGCTLVSDGCRNCYAAELAATRLKHHPSREGLARRNANGVAKFTGEVRFNAQWLDQPLRWQKPRRVFVCAHGDLFHESVPDDWIDQVFAVMALCPQHTFQVLTKRPERMREYMNSLEGRSDELVDLASGLDWNRALGSSLIEVTEANEDRFEGWLARFPLPNVWLGVSVEDQATAEARIPDLLQTPAAVRWLSCEPLLGPVDLKGWTSPGWVGDIRRAQPAASINWVVVGGESGKAARPMHPDWVRAIRDKCSETGTLFFFKQWGEWGIVPSMPDAATPADKVGTLMRGPVLVSKDTSKDLETYWAGAGVAGEPGEVLCRLGKSRTGRTLDGVVHDALPKGGA